MRKFFTAGCLAVAIPAMAEDLPPLVNVPAIAHAAPAQVEPLLGKPEFCRKARLGLSCRYAAHGVEVVFVGDKAERITINEPGDTPFDKTAIARFGLPPQEPDVATDELMRWDHLPGIAELTLYPDKDKIDYAQVVITRPPERQ